MKNSETGEFELVLGNKQLLSGFFLVVVLFAVFFVMGYIVGRNSTPATQIAATHDQPATAAAPGARPQPATGAAPEQQNPPAAATETPKEEAGSAATSQPQPTTQPAQPAPPVETKTEPATPAAVAPAQPAPGETYLQAYSGKQEVAESVAKALKKEGFSTVLSPGPQNRTRVLVGPYDDLGKLGQAKADLERLGYQPFRQKIEK